MSVRAMKSGAFEFLTKPFQRPGTCSMQSIRLLRATGNAAREEALVAVVAGNTTAVLTERERQIFCLVVVGRANKQIAGELGLSEMTVKVHRGQAMRKMKARSLPDLVRMADLLRLTTAT